MRLGDTVRSAVALPGIPVGTTGTIAEIANPFVAVRFADGRIGYYGRCQLRPASPSRVNLPPSEIGLGFTTESVPSGSHLCCLPTTGAEMLATASDYFEAGLQAGERCIALGSPRWLASLRAQLVSRGYAEYIAREDLAFVDARTVYLPPDEFTADEQLLRLGRALDGSDRRLRVFGRPGACYRKVSQDEWWDYELRATRVLSDLGASAICAYDLADQRCGASHQAELTHPFVVRGRQLLPVWNVMP